jgi:hypothetical protein
MNSLSASIALYLELPLLIVVISLVYSATRYESWQAIFHETVRWVLRMMLFLVGIVLILCGLSLEEAGLAVRLVLGVLGVGLEVSLLFIK